MDRMTIDYDYGLNNNSLPQNKIVVMIKNKHDNEFLVILILSIGLLEL